ncbi:hypothetical protein [Parerythrobacter jejuensis]|uniref:Uncharacterized protein n=1 Tax=Parerythrobacter jejuensis TaxID=795812 RepID=A0A845AN20_9SPHN|nr:hypothetical protein [Parerythrobacter jejuensis]MXP32212.1 hypothetical protein [Parerythrobacter jejuensis]
MAKMYRHFAVVTVLVTASVALMADEDAQQTVREEVAQQVEEQRAAQARANEESMSVITQRAGAAPAQANFGPETSFGSPLVATRGSGTLTPNTKRAPSKAGQEAAVWTLVGLTEEEWFALSTEMRHQLTGGKNIFLSGTASQRRAALEKLGAASRQRSGAKNDPFARGSINQDEF